MSQTRVTCLHKHVRKDLIRAIFNVLHIFVRTINFRKAYVDFHNVFPRCTCIFDTLSRDTMFWCSPDFGSLVSDWLRGRCKVTSQSVTMLIDFQGSLLPPFEGKLFRCLPSRWLEPRSRYIKEVMMTRQLPKRDLTCFALLSSALISR